MKYVCLVHSTPEALSSLSDFGALYRTESRRVLATLIRLLRDFDPAEGARPLELTTQEPERRFLERRSREVEETC